MRRRAHRGRTVVKLGLSLSPRTVRRYMRRPRSARPGPGTQAWSTFVRNHARDVLACDFFVTVTARLRLIYVFVVLDIGTRRLLHWNVTEHPTAAWTVQQFRMCVTGERVHRFVVHDHDLIYSPAVDRALTAMGLRVVTTPVAAPQANAYCERLIGTACRECLDWVISLNERHLRRVLAEWVASGTDRRCPAVLSKNRIETSPARIPLVFLPISRCCHRRRRLKPRLRVRVPAILRPRP